MSEISEVRAWIASLSGDVSHDAHGMSAPTPEEMYTPEQHALALAAETAIVAGGRGSGKSFWSGALLSEACRTVAAQAYPHLGLDRIRVYAAYTGQKGKNGVDRDQLDACVPENATPAQARHFWWAAVLRALSLDRGEPARPPKDWLAETEQGAADGVFDEAEGRHAANGTRLILLFDAVDTVAVSWPRRRLLTQALLEVLWAMRAWPRLRPKLFIRPDQLEDEGMRFVELSKLRAGAVKLEWRQRDLYALFFSRLYLSPKGESFHRLLGNTLPFAKVKDQLRGTGWNLRRDAEAQRAAMARLAGPYMAEGKGGKKKGNTYDWPVKHLADAHEETSPRAFLTCLIAAAKSDARPDFVLPPEGIRLNGLRAASKVRVDQLFDEFPWIKSALAPLAGLLLPAPEGILFEVWRAAGTVAVIQEDAKRREFLPPFDGAPSEAQLSGALVEIGVMSRREDGRFDMPDLFRVAAKLLKKGGTAPR